jgi:hypothetical protein
VGNPQWIDIRKKKQKQKMEFPTLARHANGAAVSEAAPFP